MNSYSLLWNKRTGLLAMELSPESRRHHCSHKLATTMIHMLSSVLSTYHLYRSFQIHWQLSISGTINWMIHGGSKHNNLIPCNTNQTINNYNIIFFRVIINQPDQHWKIYIPLALLQPANRRYHLVLGHPGSQHLYDTICLRFYHPGLSILCQQYQPPTTVACTITTEDHMVI